MKAEIDRLIKITQDSEAERKRAVEEIKQLKEDVEKHRRAQQDIEWENISRTLHWQD